MERNVPKLRFKGFNDELKKEKFQNLVTLQRGSSPRPIIKYITTSEDGVNWIKIGDVSTGKTFIDKTAEKITKEGAEKSRKVQVGDLILSNSMSFGRPYIMKIDGYIHDGWFVLKNYQKNFNREYLCQLLTSPIIQKQYKRLAAGGVVNNISSELVNAVIVNVPSLQEQERIANFLTKVDKIIEKQDEKVKNLEKYKKGMMQKIFSQEIRFKDENGEEYPDWEEKKLRDVTIFENGKGHEQFIIEDGDFIVINSKFISSCGKVIKKSSVNLCPLDKNDIVFVMSDVPNGKALAKCYYIEEDNKYTLNQRICSLKVLDIANSKYIFYLINRNRYYLAFDNGVGQTNLRKDEVLNCPITIPCLDEQNKIAKLLTNMDLIIENENNKFKELKQWKKGLLQQMFV